MMLILVMKASSGLCVEPSLAPGYGKLNFNPPIPGTYRLPKLGQAGDGEVVNSNGESTRLLNLMGTGQTPGKVVLLSFIYTTCSDVNGCPLATWVLKKVNDHLLTKPGLAEHVRLLTLSFNPSRDTPEQMRQYGTMLQGKSSDWHFLTTVSEVKLRPILQAYQQSVDKVFDQKGEFTNTFNHALRVFLIDRHQQIRNIYNTELLHPAMVIADIETLLLEKSLKEKGKADIPTATDQIENEQLFSAGDNKQAYDSKAYQTQSIAIGHRKGQVVDLLKTIAQPPLGLPTVPVPQDNSITPDKINLGRKLFYDRRLSLNNTFSCAMCHVPEQGFTSNEMATAVGLEGRTVRRNSPTLYNVAYQQRLFHDGRENTLEQQMWGPLLAVNEMANPSIGHVIDKIMQNTDYAGLFEKTFGKSASMETIGMAIASYERTLNSANSRFDRWYFGKEDKAITPQEQRGFALFAGKAGCSQCHQISKNYALFTDHQFHNTGIGYTVAMHGKNSPKTKQVQLAPGVFAEVPNEIILSVSEAKANDLGRYEITQQPQDRWLYKTPTLRNVGLTAPYMHNGSLGTLRAVVEFYNQGGIANENLDPLIKPLRLTDQEIADLTSFLSTLTGDNVKELVGDAFAAPIGDVQ